jgi:hypothetical protein
MLTRTHDGGWFWALGEQFRRAADPRSRTVRMVLLLATLVGLSLADLHLTLMYVTSVGMLESNPIARAVMGLGCADILSLWKMGCVALACAIFYAARSSRWAEPAAWFCVLLLVWLTFRWAAYIAEMDSLTSALAMMQETGDPKWVMLGQPGDADAQP